MGVEGALVEDGLRRAGLVMTPEERGSVRFWSTLPYALLLAFGATRQIIGEARDRPTGFLTALLIATAVLALIRWFSVDPRTRTGMELIKERQRTDARLKRAPLAEEFGMAVALFGTSALAALHSPTSTS